MGFQLKTRKHLFTVRKCWNRLSREVASSTEIIKTQPDVIPASCPAGVEVLDCVVSRGPSSLCDSEERAVKIVGIRESEGDSGFLK